MRRLIALIALIAPALAGCGGHELAACKGPVFTMNPGQWQPTAADLAGPPPVPGAHS